MNRAVAMPCIGAEAYPCLSFLAAKPRILFIPVRSPTLPYGQSDHCCGLFSGGRGPGAFGMGWLSGCGFCTGTEQSATQTS